MLSVTSLYRRHRPQTLDEVVGQQHVVKTLRNAIEGEKVNHAYLFVGSRGTGKTSVAKILARSLNCADGPTTNPCGKCDSCRSIAAGMSMDVIEMDAASHNSVEDIRDLREKVNLVPTEGKWKVYILDEAHMLSTAAWNAFLKTLEEPPPRTIFVLATTEAHKVMPTIIDRCQRFDFRQPSLDQIGEVLTRVVSAEDLKVSDEALGLIARSATGSFRDAISTLDQLLTYCGDEISHEDVVNVLGVSDIELLYAATESTAAGDAAAALDAVERVINSGIDPVQFIRDLVSHLRQIMVVQAIGEAPHDFGMTEDQAERLAEQARSLDKTQPLYVLDLLTAAHGAVRDGADSRIQLELALVKAAMSKPGTSPDTRAKKPLQLKNSPGGTPQKKEPKTKAPDKETKTKAPDKESNTPTESTRPSEKADGEGLIKDTENVEINEEAKEDADSPTDEADVQSIDQFKKIWPAVVQQLHDTEDGPLLAALLSEAVPWKLEDKLLTVAYPQSASFQKRKAETTENRQKLELAITEATGLKLGLSFELNPDLDGLTQEQSELSEPEIVELIKTKFDAEEITKES